MPLLLRRCLYTILFASAVGVCWGQVLQPMWRTENPRVLLLNTTAGWIHESSAAGMNLMKKHAQYRNWTLTVAENLDDYFSPRFSLQEYNVIVFLLTTGPIFTDVHRKAFQAYVERGGAVVGVHSSVDTNKDWPFFLDLLGAIFVDHPPVQPARMNTVDRTHPTTRFLPGTWPIEDEYYNFARPLRLDDKRVLLTVDENSYEGGVHGSIHPMTWTRQHFPAGSRIWVTALGHTADLYTGVDFGARLFQQHLALGIEWAANGTLQARLRWEQVQEDLL